MKKDNNTGNHEEIDLERRKAFRRLGLAASAVYAAPVLMTLSQAHASSSAPSASSSAPSVASAPSEPSVASAPSAPSSSAPSTSSPSSPAPTPEPPPVNL